MKRLFIFAVATFLMAGCGGGSDSESGSGVSGSPSGNYAGTWDVTFSSSLLTVTDVYTIQSNGTLTIESDPACTGGKTTYAINGNRINLSDSYTCTVVGVMCDIEESGDLVFSSDTQASGTLAISFSCGGDSGMVDATISGQKR